MKRRIITTVGAGVAAGALVLGGAGFAAAQGPFGNVSGGMHGPGMTGGQSHRGQYGAMGHGGMGMMQPGQGRGPMGGPGAGMMGDVSRHFIEEMIPHHEDAVEMADLSLIQAEHPELRQLASAIKRVQTAEIAQMRAWYGDWYGGEVQPGHMATMMGHDTTTLDGARPFDKAFIEQMIPHHEQAVHMSTMALRFAEQPEMRTLLQSIIDSQTAEIEQMRQWYRTWYGTDVPASAGGHGPMMGGPGRSR